MGIGWLFDIGLHRAIGGLGDDAMATLAFEDIMLEITANGRDHTVSVLRARTELRDAIEGARSTLAQSRTLMTEVDAALATGHNAMLPQPKLEALPVDLRAWCKS
jgi:hypothetical protein